MAKTAPTDFVPIPDGFPFPLEPVIEGNAAGPPVYRGQADFVRNLNHVSRFLRPTVVFQLEQYESIDTATGKPYLSVLAQADPTASTLRQVWRIPASCFANMRAAPRLQVRVWAETADVATTGEVIVQSPAGGGLTLNVVNGGGVWTLYSGTCTYSTAAAYDRVELWMRQTGWKVPLDPDDPLNEVAIKSVTIWVDEGDNPQPTGVDVEPWVADEPLPTYWPRMIKTKLDSLAGMRVGAIVSYSEDVDNVSTRAWFSSAAGDAQIQRLPFRYGPRTTQVRVHVNGYGPAGSSVSVWTNSMGNAGTSTSIALPLVGGWNARTSWATGLVTVPSNPFGGSESLYLTVNSGGGGTAVLSGLCAWEEPTP